MEQRNKRESSTEEGIHRSKFSWHTTQDLPHLRTVIRRISQIMAGISAAVLSVMMFITVIDVGGRFFFRHPLDGSYELVGILLIIAGTWGMGYCQLLKMNIRINLLTDRFPLRGRIPWDIVAYILCIAATGMMSWRAGLMALEYINKELGGTTLVLHMPLWPFILLMALGFGWTCLIFLADLYDSIIRMGRR